MRPIGLLLLVGCGGIEPVADAGLGDAGAPRVHVLFNYMTAGPDGGCTELCSRTADIEPERAVALTHIYRGDDGGRQCGINNAISEGSLGIDCRFDCPASSCCPASGASLTKCDWTPP